MSVTHGSFREIDVNGEMHYLKGNENAAIFKNFDFILNYTVTVFTCPAKIFTGHDARSN